MPKNQNHTTNIKATFDALSPNGIQIFGALLNTTKYSIIIIQPNDTNGKRDSYLYVFIMSDMISIGGWVKHRRVSLSGSVYMTYTCVADINIFRYLDCSHMKLSLAMDHGAT